MRIALAQIGLASVVAAVLLVFVGPPDWLVPGLLGLIPLAILMAFWRWRSYQRSMDGPDNVRIDEQGVHWIDTAGRENSFARTSVTAYHIGRHFDTMRPVPALTLHLSGGFESQPIELHPPATSSAVRRLFAESWKITEHPAEAERATDYDLSVAVYGECHDEFQEWHWEGTHDELTRFFSLFATTGDELPLPPPGAKPLARVIMLSRRQPTRLRIAHAPQSHFEPTEMMAPALILSQITAQAAEALSGTASPSSDAKFDVILGPKNVWTFHVHVRPA